MAEDFVVQGMSQMSLILFTTLSPSGACAFFIIALLILFGGYSEKQRVRLCRFIVIPIAFSMVGLIASTNHLGKPSNSLFVLTGIGRSPLSNEVAAAIVFMGLAWVFWMLSFSSRVKECLLRAVLCFSAVAAVIHIWFTANAYSIHTVVTWYLPYTQINQILVACMGGPLIASLEICACGMCDRRRLFAVLTSVSVCAAVGLLVSQLLQFDAISRQQSALVYAANLVSDYPLGIALSFAFAAAACVAQFFSLAYFHELSLPASIASCTLMLIGIAISRFGFYGAYLTAGI